MHSSSIAESQSFRCHSNGLRAQTALLKGCAELYATQSGVDSEGLSGG